MSWNRAAGAKSRQQEHARSNHLRRVTRNFSGTRLYARPVEGFVQHRATALRAADSVVAVGEGDAFLDPGFRFVTGWAAGVTLRIVRSEGPPTGDGQS